MNTGSSMKLTLMSNVLRVDTDLGVFEVLLIPDKESKPDASFV
ncbi:hypothetical protein BH10ACI2_BH10ACI2_12430 [soil metagenome]